MTRLFFCPLLALLLSPGAFAQTGSAPFTSRDLDFHAGRAVFEKIWVSAPSSTAASDGLGPRYNARACAQCHPAGRGGNPVRENFLPHAAPALVFHLDGAPGKGHQLQSHAVPGLRGEGRIKLDYREVRLSYPGGAGAVLRKPVYDLSETGLPERARVSPRLAPSLHGVGALDALSNEAVAAWADPEDADGDGISGRLSRPAGAHGPGRFGWQAQQPSLEAQVAAALSLDMGLGNPLLPEPYGDCEPVDAPCRRLPHGDSPGQDGLEVSRAMFGLLLKYARELPVPSGKRESRPRGRELFADLACAACHRPAFETPTGTIRPYSDLLLHDMGEGLADFDPAGNPQPTEWRTAPLWGAAGKGRYLHDGRAGSLEEAILWHGGEAEAARTRFMSMSRPDRRALIDFLSGL